MIRDVFILVLSSSVSGRNMMSYIVPVFRGFEVQSTSNRTAADHHVSVAL